MSPDVQWRAVAARDRRFDGAFVYAVHSTRVYCRPSCAARKPRRERTTFFPRPAEAERAGYRPCRRCHPQDATVKDREVGLAVRICRAIESRRDGRPTLRELARIAGMSPTRLQRSFARIVGVSPKKYAEAFRMVRMKELLQSGETITGALYQAGYSSPSRVYDRSAGRLGMTPGVYRRRGAAVTIRYATTGTALGRLLVAATDQGVCAVKLGDADARLVAHLKTEFDAAAMVEDDGRVAEYAEALRRSVDDHRPTPDLPLDVQATAFQARVWKVLRKIPYGETRSYAEVARAVGQPSAVRAVARACATNPAALVIPCHRVIRSDGDLGGYYWGLERKRELLARERGAGDGGRRASRTNPPGDAGAA